MSIAVGITNGGTMNVPHTWTTSDHDLIALHQASVVFLTDHVDGECNCLHEEPKGVVLPGENFPLKKNYTSVDLNDEHPIAESLFDIIEDLVEIEESNLEPSDEIQKYAFYSLRQQTYVSYTALDELVSQSSRSFSLTRTDASDVSDNDCAYDELKELVPQVYYDQDTSSFVAYTALNQILIEKDETDNLPRIHRNDHCDDDETFDDLDTGISEMGELTFEDEPPVSNSLSFEPSSPNLSDFLFYTQPVTRARPRSDLPFRLQSGLSLHSHSSYRPKKVRRRPQLTIITQLDIIQETPEGSTTPFPNTTSSTSSLDFAGHRGFIRPLLTRRTSFISDDGNNSPSLTDAEASSNHKTNVNSSVVVDVENTNAMFADDVWDLGPELHLTNLHDSADNLPSASYDCLVLDVLENIEIEVIDLVAHMFACVYEQRTSELIDSSKDLTWALNEVSRIVASFGPHETDECEWSG